jgi:peptide/nickel transport system permease protein
VLNAVSTQDLPQIMGITIVGSAAVVLANIMADICYAVIDPRVRLH